MIADPSVVGGLIHDYGIPIAFLILTIVAFVGEYVVTGRQYRRTEAERTQLLELALTGTRLAENTLSAKVSRGRDRGA